NTKSSFQTIEWTVSLQQTYNFVMSFGTATPKIAKAGVLMLSWVALGLLIVGTIAGSDYCDEADDNTVNFSYKWAKDFGTSEKTAVLVRELVRYYAYCPKLEYGSQQNTTFMLLSILGEEVPNLTGLARDFPLAEYGSA
ncbi:hypothetical protein CYMTET_33555, partial [Cymbomonas tetramitiformis]